MPSLIEAPDAERLGAIAAALRGVPRAACSVPHDYPNATPAYQSAPMVERERPALDRLRLYVHVPVCRYHCTFCYFAVRVGAGPALMQRLDSAARPMTEPDRMTQFVARSLGDGKPLERARSAKAFGRSIDDDFGAVIARLVTLAFYPEHARRWLLEREERARPAAAPAR